MTTPRKRPIGVGGSLAAAWRFRGDPGFSDARVWRRLQPFVTTVLVVTLIGIPLWLVVATAGKSQGEALNPDLSLPSDWQLWENFRSVWSGGEVPAAFFGSLLVVVPTVLGVLTFGSMAAWVLARRATRLNAALYALAISGIVLPPAVVTVVLLLRQLGLAGTAVGMIGVYMGIYMSTVVFFVTGFVRTIPESLEEAAQIDGAGPLTVFRRVVLPMLRPVLATATILICLYVWNDVFYAFFVVGGRLDTLPLNLFRVASAGLYLNNWHLIFAYVLLMSLPLVAVFAVAQRAIISGITSGAVK
jgi:raffinose/stachyose/melibiose transport system permease protein